MNYCNQCGNKLSSGDLFCTECGCQVAQRQLEQPSMDIQFIKPSSIEGPVAQSNCFAQKELVPKKETKRSTVIIIFISLALFAVFSTYIIFGEQIGTQISYWINPGIVVSFEAQIPDGETEEQITDNMNKIADITKRRLTALGYSDAAVSVDTNTLTVKHIPKNADISTLIEYIASSSYTAQFQDLDGNTVLSSAEFTSATATAGADSTTKYEISIFISSETRETFSEKLKEIASLEEGKNYIILVANDIVIVNVFINPEHAQTGWEINEISFSVPDNGDQSCLTAEELAKALNSGGALPYTLTNVKVSGTASTSSGEDQTPEQDVPQIDLQGAFDEGKTLSEVFESVDGTNHYNYFVINGGKYELWVKGDKRKLVFTASADGSSATYYNYGDVYYQYTDGVAVVDNFSALMVFEMYPIDAWAYTRAFYSENADATFVNIGSESINGEGCTVFNVMYTNINTDITYRTARIYISNTYGCIVKHVSIGFDHANEEYESFGEEFGVIESTVVEYFGLNAYTLVDSNVTMPEGTEIIENPFG